MNGQQVTSQQQALNSAALKACAMLLTAFVAAAAIYVWGYNRLG